MNKVVFITGATKGLGAEMAVAFAAKGYDVAINGRSDEDISKNGEKVADKCKVFGIKARCFVGDVSNFEDCQRMTKSVLEKFETIDVLINNAGITKDGLLPRMKEEDFTSVINVNLNSVFNMCRNVTPIMMKKRTGAIINISSVAGIYGNAGQTNYSASKAGIIGFTKSLSKELGGRGIRCNAIAPGFIQTNMTDVLPDQVKETILNMISLKRFGKPAEIAETALFLAQADYITGQVIVVDGGMSM